MNAGALHRVWYPLRELIRQHGQPQTTKAAMNARQFKGGSVRPPLRDLEGSPLKEVAQAIEAIVASSATYLDVRAA